MNRFHEPWQIGDGFVEDADGYSIVAISFGATGVDKVYAERICACVNALAGVPVDDLERLVSAGKWLLTRHPHFPHGDLRGK